MDRIELITVAVIKVDTVPDNEQDRINEKTATHVVVRKIDRRIIPFVCLLEALAYMNRTSIGQAILMNIASDLKLSESEMNWVVAIFFLAYMIFAVPSTILVRRLGPPRYLSLSMFIWGSITIGMAFVKHAPELIIIRFLLGVAEAGFFPSMIIYFSLWYRKEDHVMRIACLFGAAILSTAICAIVAYGLRYMDGTGGLDDWRWLFLFEGIPMIPLAIITCFFLNNVTDAIHWLNIHEKHRLTNILKADEGIMNNESDGISWTQVYYAFIDWKIYLCALIGIGDLCIIKYLASYFPLLIKNDMNISTEKIHLMVAPPYAAAFVCCLLAGWSSSRKREHGFHLMICFFVALLGFILQVVLYDKPIAVYVSSCLATCGIFSALPILLSWLTNNVHGRTKRSTAIGFVMGVGQIGGVILPIFYHDDKTSIRRDGYICIGIVAFSLIVTIILRVCLWLENRRRRRLLPEQREREASRAERCDWDPDVQYFL